MDGESQKHTHKVFASGAGAAAPLQYVAHCVFMHKRKGTTSELGVILNKSHTNCVWTQNDIGFVQCGKRRSESECVYMLDG